MRSITVFLILWATWVFSVSSLEASQESADLKADLQPKIQDASQGTDRASGRWSAWRSWSACSGICHKGATSARGYRHRRRSCLSSGYGHSAVYLRAQSYGSCSGSSYQLSICYKRCSTCVKKDGGWSGWSYGSCSGRCGWGNQKLTRRCTNPKPSCGGRCHGRSYRYQRCYTGRCCPVDGKWGSWSYSSCRGKCGWGVRTKKRSCCEPFPSCGGRRCPGPSIQKHRCYTGRCCPVDGKWSSWKYTSCKGKCGWGTRRKYRSCCEPFPSCGGKYCHGRSYHIQRCYTGKCCPVHGKWGSWKKSKCYGKCGWGRKRVYRHCNAPKPSCGGHSCRGRSYYYRRCYTGKCCPVNGGWGGWKYTKCQGKCGWGTRRKYRICNKPHARCGGKNCKGRSYFIERCYTGKCCKVDGKWGSWKYSGCVGKCGTGRRRAYRHCNNPSPKCGGKRCHGSSQFYRSCYTGRCCPVHGKWATWGKWGHCVGTKKPHCGNGYRRRYRKCHPPKCGGKHCHGSAEQRQACYTGKACNGGAVDGKWGSWRSTECSGKCGSYGTKVDFRSCDNPRPAHHGKDCPGMSYRMVRCRTKACQKY